MVMGLAVPLAGAALVYALWWLVLISLSPTTRTTFQYLVYAVWIGNGVVAGWIWSFLPERTVGRLGASLWAVLTVVAAAVFWFEVVKSGQGCANGPRSSPPDWIVPSLLIGAVVAAMPVLTALFASRHFRGDRTVSAVVAAVVVNFVGFFTAALVVSFIFLTTGGCNRP